MANKSRPPNRGGRGEGSGRGRGASYGKNTGRGTQHGGKGKKGTGSGQTRPPEKSCRDNMIAIPWVIVKLIFGWRPEGYRPAW